MTNRKPRLSQTAAVVPTKQATKESASKQARVRKQTRNTNIERSCWCHLLTCDANAMLDFKIPEARCRQVCWSRVCQVGMSAGISIWHLAFGIWRFAFRISHFAFGNRHLTSNIWHLAIDIKLVAQKIYNVVERKKANTQKQTQRTQKQNQI